MVIPVFNEAESLPPLCQELAQVLAGQSYEIVLVDDGSTDATPQVVASLLDDYDGLRVVCFARNFGKAEALAAGFREARGEVIITMDGDLQDNPAEIPKLLAALDEGYDLVSSWKSPRHDPPSKTIPSRFFNLVTARLSGLPLHDFNSGLKAYRRPLIESLDLYGEHHRFIPLLAHWKGFRVGEVPVSHRPRPFGRSKFGIGRFLAGLFDLFTVLFLTRFSAKPLHLFGSLGLAFLGIGLLINLYLTWIWFHGEAIGQRPLLMLGVLLMVMGLQFLIMGLLGEMMTQTSARGGPSHVYKVLEASREPGLGEPKAKSPSQTLART